MEDWLARLIIDGGLAAGGLVVLALLIRSLPTFIERLDRFYSNRSQERDKDRAFERQAQETQAVTIGVLTESLKTMQLVIEAERETRRITEERYMRLEKEVGELRLKAGQADKLSAELAAERKIRQQEIGELRKDIDNKNERVKRLQDTVDELRAELTAKNQMIEDLTQQLVGVRSERDTMQERLAALEKKADIDTGKLKRDSGADG